MNGSLASSAGYKDESSKAGWNIGGQVEYRLSKALSLTAQYNYYRFDGVEFRGSSLFGLIDNYHKYDLSINTFVGGINYRL